MTGDLELGVYHSGAPSIARPGRWTEANAEQCSALRGGIQGEGNCFDMSEFTLAATAGRHFSSIRTRGRNLKVAATGVRGRTLS